MESRITIHNYNDEIKTIPGKLEIEGEDICISLPEYGINLKGKNGENLKLNSGDHSFVGHWKNSWTIVGEWKSKQGEWKKLTCSMKDIKKEKEKSWWDEESFSDKVDLILTSFYVGEFLDIDKVCPLL